MKTISDLEDIKDKLNLIFPDAIRGSVGKCRWDGRQKVLHLSYFIGSDTVGGYKVLAKGNLLYFIEWDTNCGDVELFAESDSCVFVSRLINRFYDDVYTIDRCVNINKTNPP